MHSMSRIYTVLAASILSVEGLRAPPLFTVDLALAPLDRWHGALDLVAAVEPWETSWEPTFAYHNASIFNALSDSQWTALGSALETNWPEQAEELRGLTQEFERVYGKTVTFEYLAGWVYFHELAHSSLALAASKVRPECTGILVQGAASGSDSNVVHAANMDQSPEEVRSLTLHVRFVNSSSMNTTGSDNGDSGDNFLFQGVDWYWFTTGLTRAVKGNLASLQENWRSSETPLDVSTVFDDINAGVVPQVFVFRATLLSSDSNIVGSFNQLLNHLATVRIAAPFYIVVAGVALGEGAVLTRNETGVVGPPGGCGSTTIGHRSINGVDDDIEESPYWWNGCEVPRLAADGSVSFVVQTNYDWWLADPPNDPRRLAATSMLQQLSCSQSGSVNPSSRGVSSSSSSSKSVSSAGDLSESDCRGDLGLVDAFAVASAYPVHNPHTAYTAMMRAADKITDDATISSKTGSLVAYVRVAMCPKNSASAPYSDPSYCPRL